MTLALKSNEISRAVSNTGILLIVFVPLGRHHRKCDRNLGVGRVLIKVITNEEITAEEGDGHKMRESRSDIDRNRNDDRNRNQKSDWDNGKASYEKTGYLYDDFRMFHLKDDVGRQHEYHYHDFYKILICVSGNVTYNIEGRAYKLKPFDIVLVNRYDIHKPQVAEGDDYERIIFYISKEYLDKHSGEEYDLSYPFLRAADEHADVLRFPAVINTKLMEVVTGIEENAGNNAYAKKLYANVLFMEFMILLCRACVEYPGCFSHNVTYNQKMIDILQYINGHLEDDLSIGSIAEHFYISRYHMMRQFKEETGYTIHQYITEKRILKAQSMMMAGVPATKACYACGFQDYSTFSRAFKNKMERKPSDIK